MPGNSGLPSNLFTKQLSSITAHASRLACRGSRGPSKTCDAPPRAVCGNIFTALVAGAAVASLKRPQQSGIAASVAGIAADVDHALRGGVQPGAWLGSHGVGQRPWLRQGLSRRVDQPALGRAIQRQVWAGAHLEEVACATKDVCEREAPLTARSRASAAPDPLPSMPSTSRLRGQRGK